MTKPQVGSVVDRPQRLGSRFVPESSLKYDRFVLLARENVGKSVLVDEHISVGQAKKFRKRRRAPWYTEEGHISVSLVASEVEPDGVRYGTLFFSWIPKEGA